MHHQRRFARAVLRQNGRKRTARYKDLCVECLQPIAVGESIWWSPGVDPAHAECVDAVMDEFGGITPSTRTAEQEMADRRAWRMGGYHMHSDYLEAAAQDELTREELGYE